MVMVWSLLAGVGNVHCSTAHEDFHSLLEFKNGILDHNVALNNWNPNTHFCRWYGTVSTAPLTRRPLGVTQLNFASLGLVGQISSSLGNLTFLDTLDLASLEPYTSS